MNKILGIIILIILAVTATRPHGIDVHLLKEITVNRPHSLDHLFLLVTDTAKPIVILILILLFIIGMLKKNNKLKITSIQVLCALIVVTIVVVALKHFIDRPRPFVTYPWLWHAVTKTNPSFPSGHAAVTFALATILSLNYRKKYIVILFFLWAVIVAYSRLDLGMHYPSDVLAGTVIGIASAWFVYKVYCKLRLKYGLTGKNHRSAE